MNKNTLHKSEAPYIFFFHLKKITNLSQKKSSGPIKKISQKNIDAAKNSFQKFNDSVP